MLIKVKSEVDLDTISKAMERREPEIVIEFSAFFILESHKTQTIINHINLLWEYNDCYKLAEYGEKEDESGTLGYVFRLKEEA